MANMFMSTGDTRSNGIGEYTEGKFTSHREATKGIQRMPGLTAHRRIPQHRVTGVAPCLTVT
jgi:hypothetical protein